ncbi:MAG: GxxExxY protein [Flavisolibacter sp.]
MGDNYLHSDITAKIIESFYKVYNSLGYGFLEKVYENALLIELRNCGLYSINQVPIKVFYNSFQVGFYVADVIVENCVIIELKAAECICDEHEQKLTNYLKSTDIEVGILLNFGKKPQFKRKIFSAEYKNHNKS